MISVKGKFKKIKLLALDFDGVMTDGYVYVGQDAKEVVRCSRKDGLGIEMLRISGIDVVVISKETSPVVAARCEKLKIEYWQGRENSESKLEVLKKVANNRGLKIEQVAYMGDDLNDLSVLKGAGLAIAVADAHPAVKKICDHVTKAKGGEHAVREVCEEILIAKCINPIF